MLLDKPKMFLSPENLDRIGQGFLLTLTASPDHYANRVSFLLTSASIANVEKALKDLQALSSDPTMVSAFYANPGVDILFSLLKQDAVKRNCNCISLCLNVISNMLELKLEGISWERVPTEIVQIIATFVTGHAKVEDGNTVLAALQMLEQFLVCNSDLHSQLVVREVPVQSLIRHLAKNDTRIVVAALSLIHTLWKKSDEQRRSEIIEHLQSVPFRTAVTSTLPREERSAAKLRSIIDAVLPLEKILISYYSKMIDEKPTNEEIEKITDLELFREACSSTSNGNSINQAQIILSSQNPFGKLLTRTIERYANSNDENMRMLVGENSMRIEGGKWQWLPLCMATMKLIVPILGISNNHDDQNQPVKSNLEKLLMLILSVECPVDALFNTTIQLFHTTWREMKANNNELHKVELVVREKLTKALDKSPQSFEILENHLSALPYWKLQEIWKKEEAQKENDQLDSDVVRWKNYENIFPMKKFRELKKRLQPSIEQLVRTNRKNFLKLGFIFKKYAKGGKAYHRDQFTLWKLDPTEKILTMSDVDSETRSNNALTMTSADIKTDDVRHVSIKDIESVQYGDEVGGRKGPLRALRLNLLDGERVTVTATSDKTLSIWMDGLKYDSKF
ncbi:hypothetical protein WR25_04238 isoform D [Diploscapter pachys]|nr:hypothetical protein WR25_04238 isoform D [Diploscapter pachys]